MLWNLNLKKISAMLLEYIAENWWMTKFFWGSDIHNYSFNPNEDSLELFLDSYFTLSRKDSIDSVKSFFNDFPELLDSKYDSPRYKVWDRIERSSSNVHFVSLFYIYCYLKQYKLKLWEFPVLDDKAIDVLLWKTKMFWLLMAKELEMWLQMSFLRTTYSSSISDGLDKEIRHGHLIFPENWWMNWVKLSENNDYLEINLDWISETVERLNIAIDSKQIPKTWNVIWCPAFPKLIADIMKHIQEELRLLLNNFS